MLSVSKPYADAHPGLPDEDVAGQFLAPGQWVVEERTHHDLSEYQQNGDDQAEDQHFGLDLIIYFKKTFYHTTFPYLSVHIRNRGIKNHQFLDKRPEPMRFRPQRGYLEVLYLMAMSKSSCEMGLGIFLV